MNGKVYENLNMKVKFHQISKQDIQDRLARRDGETKIGEQMQVLEEGCGSLVESLQRASKNGARFALLGIQEDVGPRANLGRGGAHQTFEPVLGQLLHLQSNEYLSGAEILVLGTIDVTTEETQDIRVMREQVEALDQHVIAVVKDILDSGLIPLVVGGGHNNSFGLISAVKASTGRPVAAVNLDPHSDFRPCEGRHSGNGFSYAASTGALATYHILGLHQLKNSNATLDALRKFKATWHTFQSVWVKREITLHAALQEIVVKLKQDNYPVALELDLDAISGMPSSAMTSAGVPFLDAAQYVYHLARHSDCRYVHIAEGAPALHPAGQDAGARQIGQCVSELFYAFIQGRLEATSQK